MKEMHDGCCVEETKYAESLILNVFKPNCGKRNHVLECIKNFVFQPSK